MPKSIETLVEDIYGLFETGTKVDEKDAKEFGDRLAELITARLLSYGEERPATLRVSNLGKPDRQLWYEIHRPDIKEDLSPSTKLKFLFGDVWESLLLFLAKQAGHEVTNEQETVELNGVVGHIDAIIDGVLVDVKSASPHGFKKFKDGTLSEDDPFGYMEQMAGYSDALGGLDGAWLAADKVSGKLALLQIPREDLGALGIRDTVEHKRDVLASDEPPERCFDPVPFGEGGNEVLGLNCSYCPFKHECWKDANDGIGLRTFIYSNGPKHFTKVEKVPKVYEVTF